MEQKRVSFKIAKAIKEAGYPQYENEERKMRRLPERVDVPTYLDVWLWLFREKKIMIDTMGTKHMDSGIAYLYTDPANQSYGDEFVGADPEEAIIAAIDYLLDNNLIK